MFSLYGAENRPHVVTRVGRSLQISRFTHVVRTFVFLYLVFLVVQVEVAMHPSSPKMSADVCYSYSSFLPLAGRGISLDAFNNGQRSQIQMSTGETEYFVTGSTGFLGSHVVERLVDRGDSVIALTRDSSNANHLPDEVTVVEGDITQKESMRMQWRMWRASSTSPHGTR